MTDPLRQLLRDADKESAAGLPPAQIVQSVYRRRQARRIQRSLASAAVFVISVSAIVASYSASFSRNQMHSLAAKPQVKPTLPTQIESPAKALAALDAEIAIHERAANAMLASQRRHLAMQRISRASSALDEIHAQYDQAALLIYYAGQQDETRNRRRDAIAAYERTIKLFPDSHWAAEARQRLNKMES